MAALGDKDIGGLDVAVDDSFGMGGIECVGDVDGDRDKNCRLHWTARNAVLERQPIQKLHDNERLSFQPSNLVDGTDVGMVKGRSGACFPAEAFERLRVLSYILGQKLQCDKATKVRVLSFIDRAHAAAQFLDDAVVRDGSADHAGRILRL